MQDLKESPRLRGVKVLHSAQDDLTRGVFIVQDLSEADVRDLLKTAPFIGEKVNGGEGGVYRLLGVAVGVTPWTLASLTCRDEARQVFTNQADISSCFILFIAIVPFFCYYSYALVSSCLIFSVPFDSIFPALSPPPPRPINLLSSIILNFLKQTVSLSTAALVLATLTSFFSSDSPCLDLKHVKTPPPIDALAPDNASTSAETPLSSSFSSPSSCDDDENGDTNDNDDVGNGAEEEGEGVRRDHPRRRNSRPPPPTASASASASSPPPSGGGGGGGGFGGGGGGVGGGRAVASVGAGTGAPPRYSLGGDIVGASDRDGGERRYFPPGDAELVPPPAEKARRRSPPIDADTVLAWAKVCWSSMQSNTSVPGGGGGQGGRGGVGRGVWGGGGGAGGGGSGDGDGSWGEERSLGMTHAGYLKLFQLSRACLSRTYDVIMLDEAQDSNPCIASIVLRETGCARILVGDSHQVK